MPGFLCRNGITAGDNQPDGDWSIVLFRQRLAWLTRTTGNNPTAAAR